MWSPRPMTERRGCGTCAGSARASSPSRDTWIGSSLRRSVPTEPMWSPRPPTSPLGVWDLRGPKPTFTSLEGHQGAVYSASFSPDGTRVVTASADTTARVWDLGGDKPTFVALGGHQGWVQSAVFSP